MSFKALGLLQTPQFLFSHEIGTRAISVKEKKIDGHTIGILKIYSGEIEREIIFDYTEWSGFLIQYKCQEGVVSCKYILNNERGTLPNGTEDKTPSDTLYIGVHPDKELAHHAVGSFEMYILNQAEYL